MANLHFQITLMNLPAVSQSLLARSISTYSDVARNVMPRPQPAQPTSKSLALVPPGQPAGTDKLLQGFRAVAQKQGRPAAVQWLTKNSKSLQGLLRTPVGRTALAVVALGFTAGGTAGPNKLKVQALATALEAISDQQLTPEQTAEQVGLVLKSALSNEKTATPASGTRGTAEWPASPPDTLAQAQAKLAKAKVVLKESQNILAQNPNNPGQQEIVSARQASVVQLQKKVKALTTSSSTGNNKPDPPKIPKGNDPGAAGLARFLRRTGNVVLEQRINDYRNGRITREQATQGLQGDNLTHMLAALDGIDRSRLPPGGARSSDGSGASYSTAQVKEMWRQINAAEGGVNALSEAEVRQLKGITQQALKDPQLTNAERTDLQGKLASTNEAQQKFHRARNADSASETTPAKGRSRTLSDRTKDMGRKVLKERFDGKNVTLQFVKRDRFNPAATKQVTPANDSDVLIRGYPTTVEEVKKMLGGLNNSTVSIETHPYEPTAKIKVESEGFQNIQLTLTMSSRGISKIDIGEISTGGKRAAQPAASTTNTTGDDSSTSPKQFLIGAVLALKIAQYAKAKGIREVKAIAAFSEEIPGSNYRSYNGARFWPKIGFDGPIGTVGAIKLKEFLKTLPKETKWIDGRSVTKNTRVLDLLTDSKGELIPAHEKLWRRAKIEFKGSFDLLNENSKSYLRYQGALKEYGLVEKSDK
jgi:hypothetical protein